jgi:hypothetical protein
MVIKQPEDWQVFPKPELQARAKNTNNACFLVLTNVLILDVEDRHNSIFGSLYSFVSANGCLNTRPAASRQQKRVILIAFHYMKPKLQIIFLLLIGGCECYPTTKGIIIDEATHIPIENAQIEFGITKTTSNNFGQFEISSSGCDVKLIVAKDKYKPFAVKVTSKNNKIKIEPADELKAYNNNSVHFEFVRNTDSMKIYLTKIEK